MLRYKPTAYESLTARAWLMPFRIGVRLFPKYKVDSSPEACRELVFGELGPEPDMEARASSFGLLCSVALGVATLSVFAATMSGVVVGLLWGEPYGSLMIAVLGGLFVAPALSATFVWGYRGAFNDRETARWRREGHPVGFTPSQRAQPRDSDFVWMVVLWIAMIGFIVNMVVS